MTNESGPVRSALRGWTWLPRMATVTKVFAARPDSVCAFRYAFWVRGAMVPGPHLSGSSR